MPEDVIWVEVYNWYDWIAYYLDEKTWQRYSRNWFPIDDDEICKYWYVYKVECIKDWPEEYNYHFRVISRREDK